MPRIYGRSRLVQTLVEKQQFEDDLAKLDKSAWYGVNLLLLSPLLQSSFVEMSLDQETQTFLDYCRDTSDSFCLQLFYDVAVAVLGLFYSKTCVNGMLGRGIMFLFSSAHLSRLLFDSTCEMATVNECVQSPSSSIFRRGAVLDLGAGDGNITDKFRPYFDAMYATETSPTMQRRLRDREIKVLAIDDWWHVDDSSPRFQLISCLNLLDRHTKPLTLLGQLHKKAKTDNALVLIAAVLPWHQYVEYQVDDASNRGPNEPHEKIVLHGTTFEAQAVEFVEKVLEPSGFRVIRWTRLPYLCEGDMYRSLYWLDDAVFLLQPA